jgi:malate permease and related proteins
LFLIINRIAPIIILLGIGKLFQVKKFISAETVVELKKLVVNFALPAVLFTSFLFVDLQTEYFLFVPMILVYCVLLYLLGLGLHRLLKVKGEYFPFLITGFEYGMMGVSLFGAAYGLSQIGKIAIIDLGQETFIWFIYVALLIRKRDGATSAGNLLKMFATSPVIIAILAGLVLNLVGLPRVIENIPLGNGVLNAIELVGSLTVPLILIVVGYGIQIDMNEFFYSARVILIRLLVNIPAALLLNHFVVRGLMGLDLGFQAALFTLLILPPPFILTLFMKQDLKEELHSVDNTLTLHTLVTIVIFIIYYALNPVI